MRHTPLFCALASACALLLASCATTRDVQSWKDASYPGKLKKTMVVAVIPERLMRNFMEQEFVDQLKARGVAGLASNRAVAPDVARDKAAARTLLEGMGVGSLIVVKVVDKRYRDQTVGGGVAYVPAGYDLGWDGIYGESFLAVDLPVVQSSMDVMAIQMNVYDLASGKLIFSALSNTYIEGAKEKVLPPYVTTMVGRLADAKLL